MSKLTQPIPGINNGCTGGLLAFLIVLVLFILAKVLRYRPAIAFARA